MNPSSTAEKVESPVTDSTGITGQSLINGISGLLSKAADTALDVWAIRETNKNANIGSYYPTGQVDPAAVKAQVQVEQAKPVNYTPYIIGGVALVAVLGVAVIIASGKK